MGRGNRRNGLPGSTKNWGDDSGGDKRSTLFTTMVKGDRIFCDHKERLCYKSRMVTKNRRQGGSKQKKEKHFLQRWHRRGTEERVRGRRNTNAIRLHYQGTQGTTLLKPCVYWRTLPNGLLSHLQKMRLTLYRPRPQHAPQPTNSKLRTATYSSGYHHHCHSASLLLTLPPANTHWCLKQHDVISNRGGLGRRGPVSVVILA